jgi:hypothetical protein
VRGIRFESGLTDLEVATVEARFEFRFPPDLRRFLQLVLPRGEQFPNWRAAPEETLREWLDLPLEGILFDIEHNGFWLEEWGTRPPSLDEAKQVAKGLVSAAPRLIPIYGHRMIPDEPHLPGNPVFSVHQTDIIYYGADLEDYLSHEFSLRTMNPYMPVRPIRFWNIARFQEVRWAGGPRITDPRTLPESMRNDIVTEYRVEDVPEKVMRDVPNPVEDAFYAGLRSDAVPFAINDLVEILGGSYTGRVGSVISIESLKPEVTLRVELDTGEDVIVPAMILRHLESTG